MKLIKRSFHFYLLFILLLSTLLPLQAFAESNNRPVEYVALGDSLAHGYLNENSAGERDTILLGKGYPVFIKEGIEARGYEVKLTNGGFSGYQTTHVLDQLKNNDKNIVEDIETADIVTIGIGANDLLGLLLQIDIANIDLEDPEQLAEILAIFNEVPQRINGVAANIEEIMNEVQNINSKTKIYVMGYYNAFASLLDEEIQNLLIPFIHELNEKIQEVANNKDAIYVSTFEAFVGKYENYFPYPDIHPNEDGYQVIADVFLEKVMPYVESLDLISPEIALIGDNPMELAVGEKYIEPGATATDNIDGDLTEAIEITSDVDTSTAGTYTVTYTVSDAAGNIATAVRTIHVVEVKEPVKPGEPVDPVEPVEPEEPVIQKDPVDPKSPDNSKGHTASSNKGESLPKTATSYPLTILIGSLLVIAGGFVVFIQRRVLN